MLIATYDYWGYYNITFLGGEVKDAGAHGAAGDADLDCAGGGDVPGDECLGAGGAAWPGIDGGAELGDRGGR